MPGIVAIGAGEKGQLLLEHWARNGHEIAAVASADVVLIDVAVEDVDLVGLSPSLAGKIIIDCSSAESESALRSKMSGAEAIADACPAARVVKAFNVINAATLRDVLKHPGPEVGAVYPSGYFCGDDRQAKTLVAGLVSEANLEPIDCGPLANAMLLESLGVLSDYLEKHGCGPVFSISVARDARDRSPLDSVL